MEKYTYKDVVTIKDIMTGEVDKDALIGKKGWMGDCIKDALRMANCNEYMRQLHEIDYDLEAKYPFISDGTGFIYFVPAKNQDKDDVKWLFGCDADGKPGIVSYHSEDEKTYYMRFNNLLFRDIPEKDFRKISGHLMPFEISDISVRHAIRGEWIFKKEVDKDGNIRLQEYCISGFDITLGGLFRTKSSHIMAGEMRITPLELLTDWHFLGGMPCGVVVEDKEERP